MINDSVRSRAEKLGREDGSDAMKLGRRVGKERS